MYLDPARPVNVARFVFLSPRARIFFLDWERAADDIVAILRSEAGRNPYDRALTDLVGELSTRSDEFATRWATHNVRFHRTGFKDIHHPVVGDLHLTFEAMELPADPGLSLVVYSAEPGSASADGLADARELGGQHRPAHRPACREQLGPQHHNPPATAVVTTTERTAAMRGTILHAPGDIRLEERADPQILEPTDAIVRTVATCVCGSDLWPYRGSTGREAPARSATSTSASSSRSARDVATVKPGDFVIGGFLYSDNTCPALPGRLSSPPVRTAAGTTAARPSSSGSRSPTAPWWRRPASRPTTSCRACWRFPT